MRWTSLTPGLFLPESEQRVETHLIDVQKAEGGRRKAEGGRRKEEGGGGQADTKSTNPHPTGGEKGFHAKTCIPNGMAFQKAAGASQFWKCHYGTGKDTTFRHGSA